MPSPTIIRPRAESRPLKDLELRWDFHIPFTSRKSEKKRGKKYYILQQPVIQPIMVHPPPPPPPTPPLTPIVVIEEPARIRPRRQAHIEVIAPRYPVQEHRRPRSPIRPNVHIERSRDRLERARAEAAYREAAERAALDAHIEGLRAQLRAQDLVLEEAQRDRSHHARIRAINEEIAALRDSLDSSQRRRRRAEGNVIHQDDLNRGRPARHAPRPSTHDFRQPDFRPPHQDAGGGNRGTGGPDGAHFSDGNRTARNRARDREIRNLERQISLDRDRLARRGGILTESDGLEFDDPLRRFGNPFRRAWSPGGGVRVEKQE